MTLKKYIQEAKQNNFNVKGVQVFLKDPPINDVQYEQAVSSAISKIPSFLLANLKTINIGVYQEMQDREIQAMYENGNIFLTNKHESNEDAIDDIVHEIAHSIEDIFGKQIYSDKTIEKEFLQKRKQLWFKLKNKGFEKDITFFLDTKYNEEFDMYLYMDVGYSTLELVAKDIFYSPYGATSLREYFANSFEAFFMKEQISRLKRISPAAYRKNVMLLNMEK